MNCKCGHLLPENANFCSKCGIPVPKSEPPKDDFVEKKEFKYADSLPDYLTAKHIAEHLSISRRRVYELFQLHPECGGIPNMDIGFSKRVDKQDYLAWLEARKQEKAQKIAEIKNE